MGGAAPGSERHPMRGASNSSGPTGALRAACLARPARPRKGEEVEGVGKRRSGAPPGEEERRTRSPLRSRRRRGRWLGRELEKRESEARDTITIPRLLFEASAVTFRGFGGYAAIVSHVPAATALASPRTGKGRLGRDSVSVLDSESAS